MRRLKPRQPADIHVNEARRHRLTIIRWIYLASVGGAAIWLLNLFFGGLFYLKSEGMVLGEPSVVAAEFPTTVRDIRVHEGDRVTADQVVGVISSQSVAETLARFAGQQADRKLQITDLRMRGLTVDQVIGLAETRRDISVDARRKMEALGDRGFLALDKRTAAIESVFRSSEDVAKLEAEQAALRGELSTLAVAFEQADTAVSDLRRQFDDGKLHAPASGIVGSLQAQKGAVLSPGQPLMEIYGDDRFVLAYLPTGGLFSVAQGDHVRVSTGLQTFGGTIERVEPIAAALPHEFQRAFTPVDRQQIIRIRFDAGQVPPPLFSKVSVTSGWSLPGWLPAR